MENVTFRGSPKPYFQEGTMTPDPFTRSIPDEQTFIACCSANCSYNGKGDCDSLLETVLRANLMSFGHYQMMRVILTSTLFVISFIGNAIALWSVFANRRTNAVRGMTNTQVIMLHMTLADLAFTLFILPMDAVWNATGQWLAGNAMCKISNFFKFFGMYSSSGMITVMALERMTCILTQPTPSQQKKRMTAFVVSAWLFAFLNAIPSLVLFGVMVPTPCKENCPDHSFSQCIDFILVKPHDLRGYYIYTMLISFFIPLVIIVICHALIAMEITRMAVRDRALMGRRKSVTTNHIQKARNKSLLVTVLITLSFLLCWGPYYVKGLYDWSNPTRGDDGKMWMYLSMYLNPCLHPIIFAIFMKSVKRQFKIVWSIIFCCGRREKDSSGEKHLNRNSHADSILTTTFHNGHNKLHPQNGNSPGGSTEEATKSLLHSPKTNKDNNRKTTFSDDVK